MDIGDNYAPEATEETVRARSATEWLKQLLPFAGLPFICAALLLIGAGGSDAFILLRIELITIIGFLVAVEDIKTRTIPNRYLLILLVSWIVIMTPKLFIDTNTAVKMLLDSVLGFAAGGGLFLLVYVVSKKGLGGGDVKFMAVAGIYLGLGGTVVSMLYGSILAMITALVLIGLKKIKRDDAIPLAPFLYIGILITVFFAAATR